MCNKRTRIYNCSVMVLNDFIDDIGDVVTSYYLSVGLICQEFSQHLYKINFIFILDNITNYIIL